MSVISATREAKTEFQVEVEDSLATSQEPTNGCIAKYKDTFKKVWECSSGVVFLPTMHETLSFIPSSACVNVILGQS